jgi:hypothetical protein
MNRLCTLAGIAALTAMPLAAQSSTAVALGAGGTPIRFTIAGGLASAETILRDGSGLLVRGATGAYLGGEAVRRLPFGSRTPLFGGVFARYASRRATVRSVGGFGSPLGPRGGYDVGQLVEATLGARGELVFLSPFSLRAGVGATFTHGPRDVQPFASGSLHPSAELGLALRAGTESRWSIDVRAAAYRLGASSAVDHAGAVRTILFELRRDL